MQMQVVRQQDSDSIHIANSATSLVNCSLWIVYFVAKGKGERWHVCSMPMGNV